MQRRDFCKLIAAATAARSIGVEAQAGLSAPAGFNKLHQTYEEFCSTPEKERVFYALVDGKIVETKLDNSNWTATEWGQPPELPGGSWDGVPMQAPIEGLNGDGPFQANWDSLLGYEAPEWYRDAKFGIWAHWSPQCVPEHGDWYARLMYMEGSPDYDFQTKRYGHPSVFGYKDLCAQWTLLDWEPEALIQRYKNAGARLFISLANHHDGFDCWGSKHQPWNAVNHGPHRDVVGEWADAARKDKNGPFAGVSYDGRMTKAEGKGQWWDGLDPQMLYSVKHPKDALPDASYVKHFYDRTRDLIEQHDPDLLYFDNALLPLGWGGMNVGAYFYNHNLKTRGKMEAVLNIKNVPDKLAKAVVADYERGLTSGIMPYAWQSETCIGEWHYRRSLFDGPGQFGGYLPPRDAIHWLVDTVSKNGTFILNIPGKPDGTIDSKEIAVLDEIADWLKINGEAIFETRPWTIYGEGPTTVTSGPFQGGSISAMGSKDIRFTRNKANNVIYAIFMGWPGGHAQIASLGLSSKFNPGKIQNVTVLGSDAQVKWTQEADALHLQLPYELPVANSYGAAVKIALS
ncbi:Alpha-L-fucosidase [Candidatus Sulfotelmatomonas gaucii]|uniref:alpha-L-fucosidase n=1 Tax=Candidatus Sulfuritelmatomonas gaucii TaxID=2043161 RepID=A0A2N9L4X4_9BACT|nr:Alpha-L-fucosidase [Candidatus Sulfotelmatomonas gaucii]